MADPYSPPIGGSAIRLFRIDSAADGVVSVELRRFALKGPACPPFVATSYVWGPPSHADGATINGQPRPILSSALSFLKVMLSERWRQKFPPEKTWWWMDSICINQKDDNERSAQVQLMSTIYPRARRTVIWLGEESEDSDRAMDFLSTLSTLDPLRDPLALDVAGDAKSWTSVANLLRRDWFERGWTLQEFLLSRHAIFCCGGKQINQHRMFDAVGVVWDYHQWKSDIIPRKAYEKAWNRFRMLERYSHELSLPLVGTLAYTATSRVTDPRDRLYSLLGLAGPIDREVVGRPDYESDPELVFIKFVKSFVEKHQSLDIVCLAATQRGLAEQEDLDDALNLPSWVPDWSVRLLHSGPVPCMASQSARTHIGNFRPMHSIDYSAVYAAYGAMGPHVHFSDDLREMTCAGVLIDHIDGLGGVRQVRKAPKDLVQSTSAVNTGLQGGSMAHKPITTKRASTLIGSKLALCLVLDRKDRYLRHSAPLGEFSRQFKALCQALARKVETTLPVPFTEWFQLTKDLLIHGVTVEAALLSGQQGPQGSQGAFDFQDIAEALLDIPGLDDWESFVSRLRDTSSTMGMRLMVTDSGMVGMAPREAKKGDVVCVLYGCSIPVVLRQVPESDPEVFQVIGECFMAGFMNGEIWKAEFERQNFCLV